MRFTINPDDGCHEVGFPVAAPFDNSSQVHCMNSWADGRHITHRGPYSESGKAHSQLNEWCAARSLELAAESWEVYGDGLTMNLA